MELSKTPLREISDLLGRHVIRLDDTTPKRNALISRLEGCECTLDRSGTDWLSAGKFDEARL